MMGRVFIAGKGQFLGSVGGSGFVVARRYGRTNPEWRKVYEHVATKKTRKLAVEVARKTDKLSAEKIVILSLKSET
jgi:hypothetical protein